MKIIGQLIYWDKQKGFGFVETRTPEPIGIRLERYFLHANRIILQPSEIHEGQTVRFELSEHKSKTGQLPCADSAEIFEVLSLNGGAPCSLA
jgi:cold shock CspA family protein